MAKVDPHSYYDDCEPKIKFFDLDMKVNFEEEKIYANIRLNFERKVRKVTLDTRNLLIKSIKDDKGNELSYKIYEEDPILGNKLDIELKEESDDIFIDYEIGKNSKALQWLKKEQTKGKRLPFLFTQCQPHHARSLIPIQDTPSVRVTYKASITVDKDLSAVMAAAYSHCSEEGGKKTFFFRMPQPIPPYLFAFAIGDIVSKEIGPRSKVYAEPEILEKAAYEFEEIESMIKKAEELFGTYEWERYDLLVLPPSFPYGGMENPRVTFLTPTLIVGDRSLVSVVAHELAHSWTGNLVTNKNAEHFWINEGFTVWAERRILEAVYGAESAVMAYAQGFNALKNALSRFGEDSPFTKLVPNLEGIDPDEVFSEIPYEKGSLFLKLIEETVSRPAFDRFIRAYIEKFRFTSIDTDDVISFLEKHFPGLMDKIQGQRWLYEAGLPENCPKIVSSRLEYLKNLSSAFKYGTYPTEEEIALMNPNEKLVYFQGLPRVMTKEQLDFLTSAFNLKEMTNSEILCEYLAIAAGSDYEPAFEQIRKFLYEVGRLKFIRPIYKAMGNNKRTRLLAKEIFEKIKEEIHPLTKMVIESEISKYKETE